MRRQRILDAHSRRVDEHIGIGLRDARRGVIQQLGRAQLEGAVQPIVAEPFRFGVTAHAVQAASAELLVADQGSARDLAVDLRGEGPVAGQQLLAVETRLEDAEIRIRAGTFHGKLRGIGAADEAQQKTHAEIQRGAAAASRDGRCGVVRGIERTQPGRGVVDREGRIARG